MKLETNIEVSEPALFVHLNTSRVAKLKVSHAIRLLNLMGYESEKLKYQYFFDYAQCKLAYSVKYN